MNAPIDLRPRLLAGWLTRSGVPPQVAGDLVANLRTLPTNAERFAAARALLRQLNVGPTTTRELLQAYGLWDRETCAREGCGREVGCRHRCVIVKRLAYCSTGCALVGIGVAS